MCVERVEVGLLPACVKTCPTGALNFGDEAEIKKLTNQRFAAAKKKFGGNVQILDAKDVRALFLVLDDLPMYLKSA